MVKTDHPLFKPAWRLTCMTLAAIALFLWLGHWQLRRAAEKQALLDIEEHQLQLPPVELTGAERLDGLGRYRRVRISGVWDGKRQFLLDNRIFRGRAGYEVLTPLEVGGGWVVLVNRGWVAATGDRRLPEIFLSSHPVSIWGRVDRFPRPGMELAGMRQPSPGWPAVVQELVPAVVAARLGREVADLQIKMDPELPEGYVREWRLDFVKPERHLGYALQWFVFAVISCGLWIRHGLKRAREGRLRD